MKVHIKYWGTVAGFLVIWISACVYLYFNGLSGVHPESTVEDGKIRVACVGDSITYGLGIENWPQNNYPTVLEHLLGTEYQVNNFGESGRCVQETADKPYVKEKSYTKSLTYEPDIVVFMMGTNDSKSHNWVGEEAFLEAYEKILESYRQTKDDLKLYICTPATAFYIKGKTEGIAEFDIQPQLVEQIAELVREFAQTYDGEVGVIDINLMTKDHPEWFEKDGIHPSGEGAKAIAEYIAEAIK